MNRLLIIIPTQLEAKLLISALQMKKKEDSLFTDMQSDTHLLICGPGIPASMFNTMQHVSKHTYQKVILAGIAGTYHNKLPAGDLVCVKEEFFADIGVQNKNNFQSLSQKSDWETYYSGGSIVNPNEKLMQETQLKHVTSNTVSMNNIRLEGFPEADIENMEGAGMFMIFNNLQIPFVEIRAISNPVEERNIAKWDMHTALENLTDYLIENHIK